MLRQRFNQPLVLMNSPEDDLQEISMLEDSNPSFEYKSPVASGKNEKFRLDGWFTPTFENQNLFKTCRSHVIRTTNLRNDSRRCGQHKGLSERVNFFRSQQSIKKKPQFANFRLKRAQSYEFQINSLPISELKESKIELKNEIKKQCLSLNHFQRTNIQKNDILFLAKRSILQSFTYPLMKQPKQNSPQRKLTENVGRVRRMLKSKLQSKK